MGKICSMKGRCEFKLLFYSGIMSFFAFCVKLLFLLKMILL